MSSGIHPFDELDLSDVEQLIDELEGEDAALPHPERGHDFFEYQPVSGATGEPRDEARWCLQPARSTPPPAAGDSPGRSTQVSKKAKLKEKNRQAQARYRQRKLEEVKELETKLAATQQHLTIARERLKSGQAFSRELAERCKTVTAAMLHLTDPNTSMSPQRNPTAATAPPAPPAPAATPQAYDLSAQVARTAQHAQQAQPSPAASKPPNRPADTLPHPVQGDLHEQCISNSPLLPLMPPQPPLPASAILAPLDPAAVFTHLSGPRPPLSGGPMLLSLQLLSAAGALGTPGRPGGAAQALPATEALVRQLHSELSSHRTAAAAAAAVEPSRIAWYLQAPYTVSGGRRLAFSTALATPECLASQFLFLVASCLEGTFVSAALSRTSVSGQTPRTSGTPAARLQPQGPPTRPYTAATDAEARTADASAAAHATVAHMAAVVQAYPLCSAHLQGSCGVGNHFSVASGAAEVIDSICQRYRGLLPRATWIQTCSAFAQLMLAQRSNSAPWLPCSIHGIYGPQNRSPRDPILPARTDAAGDRDASSAVDAPAGGPAAARGPTPARGWPESHAASSGSGSWAPRGGSGDEVRSPGVGAHMQQHGLRSGIAAGAIRRAADVRQPTDPRLRMNRSGSTSEVRRRGPHNDQANHAPADMRGSQVRAAKQGLGRAEAQWGRGDGVGQAGDGAVPPHDAAMCPRCGVLSSVAEVLRKVLQEVVESASPVGDAPTQAALDAAAAAGELRVRAQDLYAAYAVFLSQCCTDAPHLTRHLKLNSTSSDPQQKASEEMHMKLYRQLRLPPRQLQLTAAVAEYWRRRREVLDMDLRLSAAPLAKLPSLQSLPRAAVFSICGLTIPPTPPDDDGDNLKRFYGSLTLREGGAGEGAPTVLQARGIDAVYADLDAEFEQGICALCGKYGCSEEECGRCVCECRCGARQVSWQRRLLGCDPAASAAARAAVRRLRRFQESDTQLFADMQRAVRMPGGLFTADQMVGGLPTALQYAVPFVDWLRVCQTAAGEARADSLRSDVQAMGWSI